MSGHRERLEMRAEVLRDQIKALQRADVLQTTIEMIFDPTGPEERQKMVYIPLAKGTSEVVRRLAVLEAATDLHSVEHELGIPPSSLRKL